MTRDKPIANFCFKQIFLNVCQYFVATFCYKTQKPCLSLSYATDLKCCCITVQFSIAQGTKSPCNKYCTHTNVKAYRTISVKLWKKLIHFYKDFQHFPLLIRVYSDVQQNQVRVQKMHGNKLQSFNQSTLMFKIFRGKLPIPLCRRGRGALPLHKASVITMR